ncbi:MAG: RNA polymerase sigma factor [Vicinamibacterales bacterium]
MLAYQGGSVEAFRDLYGLLAPSLGRYLRYLTRRRDVADDLLQETFLQLHRSRAAYDPALPLAPWVFGLARNVFLMHRRRASRFAAVHDASGQVPEVPVPPEAEAWAQRDRLQRAVAALDTDQAEPLLLHHVWGFSFEEIAGMTGLTSAAARARSSRAMAVLRRTLAPEEGAS